MPSVSPNFDQGERNAYGVEKRSGEGEATEESEAKRPRREETEFEQMLETEGMLRDGVDPEVLGQFEARMGEQGFARGSAE